MVGNEKKKLVKKPRQSSFVAGLNKRQDAVDYLTTKAVNQTRQMSKQAEATAKANIAKKNKTNKALTAKHGSMYDYTKVMQIQKQLKDAGFYKGAIDGDWGKGTQAAWEAYSAQKQQDNVDNNIAYNLGQSKHLKVDPNEVRQALGGLLSHTLNNMFPFGYDTSSASQKANETLAANGINIPIGGIYGGLSKIVGGITGTSQAGQASKEYADLDLSNPDNYAKADSLWQVIRQEEPRWGPRGSRESRQFKIRGRMDQNSLHGGHPQKYDTWTTEGGYVTSDGDSTYTYSDPQKRAAEQAWARNYVKTHKGKKSKDGKHLIFQVAGGDPYSQHGNSSIITDLNRKHGKTCDIWDFGFGPISTNLLPGAQKVVVGTEF